MAVKITRHPEKIVLLGVPTSAAAMERGHERAPAALRTAGLIDRLKGAGYEVADHGDDPTHLSDPDPESPRARNLKQIVKSLESLRPRVEAAVKTGALPVILTGDCTSALATVAGVRRYFHNVSMIYVDRDADLNVPATTPSGCVDGMVVAHLTGRGAAELVRFWGEPPLVRDPDLAIFGTDRFDPPEEQLLQKYPIRSFPAAEIKKKGAAATAKLALERVHASRNDFILHFDVDVIADFAATDYPGQGGLTKDEVREALEVFVKDKHLAAIDIAAFNPAKDVDGSAAKALVDLIGDLLQVRLETLRAAASQEAAAAVGLEAPGAKKAAKVSEAETPASRVAEEKAPEKEAKADTEAKVDSEPEPPEENVAASASSETGEAAEEQSDEEKAAGEEASDAQSAAGMGIGSEATLNSEANSAGDSDAEAKSGEGTREQGEQQEQAKEASEGRPS
jgi:arginase